MPKGTTNRKKRQIEFADVAELASLQEQQVFTSEYREKAFAATERSITELAEYFRAATDNAKQLLPTAKRRYAIYLRKSTDTEDKQVRSIDDQRKECLELASRKLQVAVRDEDIFEEHASAKKSGNRPVFDEMLQGFRTGKYHGLISWSPDRVSRNMKEAGEVIEMVDEESIQDLHFCTYAFENNPNGKMMLGILFATSKQYSDKLSVDVKRGNTGNITEGKYNGSLKKGYYVDESTGNFMPDEYNWQLLRRAVDMRLYGGMNNPEIAQFLLDHKFTERKSENEQPRVVKVTKKMVGELFADPFYAGLYKYGNLLTVLTDQYNFRPLISPDEYIALNADVSKDFGKTSTIKSSKPQKLDYGLLRNKVICDFCSVPMHFQHQPVSKGTNKGKYVISYYCRNKACLRHNTAEQKLQGIKLAKSIRAKYVLAGIEWQLRHLTKKSEQAYRMYISGLESRIASDKAVLKNKLAQASQLLKDNERQYAKYQTFQLDDPEEYKRHHKGKLEHHKQLIDYYEEAVADNKAKLAELDVTLPSEAEFYELTQFKVLEFLKSTDITTLDTICNEFVANLRAGDNSTPVIELKKPYDSMVDLDKIPLGWG